LNLRIPIIDVASSAAKKWLEPIIISKYIIKKFEVSYVKKKKIDCGVVGFGATGKAVADALSLSGHNVTVYDKLPRNIIKNNKYYGSNTLSSLISTSDYVFGCTGSGCQSSLQRKEAFQAYQNALAIYRRHLTLLHFATITFIAVFLYDNNALAYIKESFLSSHITAIYTEFWLAFIIRK
jgi:S-adenosylhomocysteine hydrolase